MVIIPAITINFAIFLGSMCTIVSNIIVIYPDGNYHQLDQARIRSSKLLKFCKKSNE